MLLSVVVFRSVDVPQSLFDSNKCGVCNLPTRFVVLIITIYFIPVLLNQNRDKTNKTRIWLVGNNETGAELSKKY